MKFVASIWFKTVTCLAIGIMLMCYPLLKTSVKAQDRSDQWTMKAKNIIFFVGDGMGPGHRELIRLMSVGPKGQIAMNEMPYTGLSITNSTSIVTDSAAGATAWASGIKSYNGAIGVDIDKNPVETVLEKAKKSGKATGIVTTSQVTDATGAAFGAHVTSRDSQTEIAKQFLQNNKVDVILGGGKAHFVTNQVNLVNQAKNQGYTYVTNINEMNKAEGSKILGLFADEEMFTPGSEGKGVYEPSVSLPDMTQKAINILSNNENGFFLVVEEEGIDGMAHENNAELTIKSGKQLNSAVEVAKKYAKTHPDTLIIVGADHETGGLAIEAKDQSLGDGPFPVPNTNQEVFVDWTTKHHTAVFVPITAMGPGAEKLTGIYQNTHIHDVMIEAMNLK
ncbi:alkaline phosphatase [Bacillus thuringiensis]